MNLVYRVLNVDEDWYFDINIPNNLSVYDEWDQESIASLCAEDYYYCHDGWESNWPLTFSVHLPGSLEELFEAKVEVEMTPHFSPSLIEHKEEVA